VKLFDVVRAGVWLLGLGWLCGCLPLPDQDSEEKNPLIVDARAKKTAYNFQGAVASLEKALEGNPRLALAHWELGLLFCQQVPDPAAAIYHFQKLLKLRPDWRHAETARQKIKDCQIELAKNVPLGPQVPAIQQQFDLLVSKVHETEREANRLRTTNQTLRLQLQQAFAEYSQLRSRWEAYAAWVSNNMARATSPPDGRSNALALVPSTPDGTGASAPRATPPGQRVEGSRAASSPPGTAASSSRLHTVRSGETLMRIAQRYGVKLQTVISANPTISPNRLRPGQVVRIPAPSSP